MEDVKDNQGIRYLEMKYRIRTAHHENGCEDRVDTVRPDAGAVHESREQGELVPEQRAVVAAEEDLEVTLIASQADPSASLYTLSWGQSTTSTPCSQGKCLRVYMYNTLYIRKVSRHLLHCHIRTSAAVRLPGHAKGLACTQQSCPMAYAGS